MMILNYETKKELKENIGKPLNYTETSWFGPEYVSTELLQVAIGHILQVTKGNFLQL